MKKVKLSSDKNTPDEFKVFVIETPAVDRVKMRLKDVTNKIAYIDEHTTNLAKEKVELEDIKSQMETILNK